MQGSEGGGQGWRLVRSASPPVPLQPALSSWHLVLLTDHLGDWRLPFSEVPFVKC